MKTTVVIVGNPTQYWNAVEFRTQFPDTDRFVLVCLSIYAKQIDHLRRETESAYGAWFASVIVDTSSAPTAHWTVSGRRAAVRIVQATLKAYAPQRVIVGNLGDPTLYCHLLWYRQSGARPEIVALDDGTPSLAVLEARGRGTFYRRYHWRRMRWSLRHIAHFGPRLQLSRPVPAVTFFTVYGDARASGPGDVCVTNDYAALKARFASARRDAAWAAFIGQNMADAPMMPLADYARAVAVGVEALRAKGVDKVTYVPHRASVARVTEALTAAAAGVDVYLPDEPVELWLARERVQPGVIGGFVSSALVTLARLAPPELSIIAFDVSQHHGVTQATSALYAAMRSQPRLEVITLDERQGAAGAPSQGIGVD